MLIRRQIRKTKAVDVTTQTQQDEYSETCHDVVSSSKKGGWYDPMTIITSTADLSSTETKEYDSAYDTLNKSSRCSQQAPTLAAPSDDDEVESSNTEQTLTQNDPFYKESVSTCSEHSSNKHTTYLVVQDKENFDMSIGHTTEGEADFECEYEVRFLSYFVSKNLTNC